MKNQNGFASILLASIVLLMVVTFMGSAGVYFNSLYRDLMLQQRAVAADVVMEDFGKMIQQASHVYASNGNACPATGTYDLDNANRLCWPKTTGATAAASCVRHPLGNSGGPRTICRKNASSNRIENRDSMDIQDVTAIEFELRGYDSVPFPDQIKNVLVAGYSNFQQGLDLIAWQLQNVAVAQVSDAAHLPNLGGAPNANFSTALACPAGGATGALSAYCKYCATGTDRLQSCVRIKVCLSPAGCGADESEWVRRTIGIIRRNI